MDRDKLGRFLKGSVPHNKGKVTAKRTMICRKCGGPMSNAASYTTTTGLCRKCYLVDLHNNRRGRTPNVKCEICGKPLYRRPWQIRERSFFCCSDCRREAVRKHPHVYARIANEDFGNRFKKGVKQSDSSKKAQSIYLKKKYRNDPSFRRRLAKIRLEQCRNARFTSLELPVYEFLRSLGIRFIPQKLINYRFIVDAYIPKKKLAIEVDGKYWHSLEKTRKKDYAENSYLRKCGYKVLRIPEQAIKDETYREMITNYLSK